MRTILGPRIGAFTYTGTTATATAATGTAATKADPIPEIATMHHDTKDFSIDFHVQAVDPATHNRLMTITAVVVPVGHGLPMKVEDWMASSYPRGSVDVSTISTTAAATAATVATSTQASTPASNATVAATVPAASPVVVATPVVDPTSTTVATPIAATVALPVTGAVAPTTTPTATVAGPTPASTTTTVGAATTPAVPTGATLVNLPIQGLANNQYQGQILLTYDS